MNAPSTTAPSDDLPFLRGYPPGTLAQVRALVASGGLRDYLRRRYPEPHAVRSDGALYEHVNALRQRHLRNAPPLAKVHYDNRLQVDQRALGTLPAVSRVQGGRLKAKREIRVAAVFRDAPAAMLRMIVVHELAHLKEREHDKAFYALCEHMQPDYHQVEFDTRLWLTWKAMEAATAGPATPPAQAAG